METIEFKHVSFTYPNCDNEALNDINLQINESEFVVICGASGCGKTTLLRHMKKNMIPYGRGTGDILYMGQDIETLDDRVSVSEIGYVQQNPDNQIITDRVWHELAFGLESLGQDNLVIRKKTAEIAEYFGISNWFRKSVWQLSGGQKQLLNLAAIMVMQPKVLILDEPTAQLDPIAATQFIETLGKINRDFGTTIILSEHRLEDVFSICDKVLVMDKGNIVIFDTPLNVASSLTYENHPFVYGLPSAMKIYSGVKKEGLSIQPPPITVKDGRLWLNKLTESYDSSQNRNLNENIKENLFYIESEDKCQYNEQSCRNDNKSVVDLNTIFFRYERKEEDILRGLNLSVNKGEMLAILGGNGAGKTTLLKILAGIKKPYSGVVKLDGKVIALPQNSQAIFTEITVEEELWETFLQKGSHIPNSKDEVNHQIEKMLDIMDLKKYRKKNPYDLSGGEQQKLAIGKVLLLQPDILLLDEPTKGIDPFFKSALAKILGKALDNGVTIIMVSHDIEFCAEYATRCALLFDGEIVSQGDSRQFFGGNNFYTTAAHRISKHVFQNCVTCDQVIEECLKLIKVKDKEI